MLRFSTTLLLAATCLVVRAGVATDKVTTCTGVHRLSCDTGVISVQTVLYGRADSVTCSEGKRADEISNTDCSLAGTEDVLKSLCDGKRVCELNSNVFRASDPCTGIFKYLQTTYTCLPAIHQVVCEHSYAHLQCGEGQSIFIYRGDYGRHDSTTCSYNQAASKTRNTNCLSTSNYVSDSCNGKESCVVKASNSKFGDPCVGTYKYLEVAYECRYPVADTA